MPDEPQETIRIYYYGDSGPYGNWTEAGKLKVARDGWGISEIKNVPKVLWERYCAARQEVSDLEDKFDDMPDERAPGLGASESQRRQG